jgi:hypothetical protein
MQVCAVLVNGQTFDFGLDVLKISDVKFAASDSNHAGPVTQNVIDGFTGALASAWANQLPLNLDSGDKRTITDLVGQILVLNEISSPTGRFPAGEVYEDTVTLPSMLGQAMKALNGRRGSISWKVTTLAGAVMAVTLEFI